MDTHTWHIIVGISPIMVSPISGSFKGLSTVMEVPRYFLDDLFHGTSHLQMDDSGVPRTLGHLHICGEFSYHRG